MHPYLLHSGHLFLPTFGVLAAVGLMLALGLSQYTARMAGVDPDKLWDAGLAAMLAAFVFSRALLVAAHLRSFLDYPILLLAVPSLTATGLFLTAVATYLWLRFKGVAVLAALDAWAPCATVVWCFLALGHFAEGSDAGMPTALALGVRMPGDMPGDTPALHPVALSAAFVAVDLTAFLLYWLHRSRRSGETAALALITVGVSQFLISFLRQPSVEGLLGLDILQVVALAMIVAGCVLFLASEPRQETMEPERKLD